MPCVGLIHLVKPNRHPTHPEIPPEVNGVWMICFFRGSKYRTSGGGPGCLGVVNDNYTTLIYGRTQGLDLMERMIFVHQSNSGRFSTSKS